MSDDPNNMSGDTSGDDPRGGERSRRPGDADSHDRSSNFEEDAAGEHLTSEEELDKMLAHAGGLAEELATDVGARPDDAGVMVTAEEEGDEEQSVDAMLSELDDLVAAAAEEIDPEDGGAARADRPGKMDVVIPPATDEAAEDADAYGVSNEPPPQLDVPDFMREFTEPEEPAAEDSDSIGEPPLDETYEPPPLPVAGEMTPLPPPPMNEPVPSSPDEEDGDDTDDSDARSAAGTSDAVPDFMMEFTEPAPAPAAETPVPDPPPPSISEPAPAAGHKPVDPAMGVVGAPVVEDEGEAEAELEEAIHDVDAELQERAQAESEEQAAAELKGLAALKAKVSPLIDLALSGAGRGLEAVDSPLNSRDPRIRTLTGFIALSTLGTAVVVYLITLF